MLAVKGTKLSNNLGLKHFHGVKEKHSQATWQASGSSTYILRKMQKRPLAHATSNNKNSNQTSEHSGARTLIYTVTSVVRSYSAIVTFLGEIWPLY